MTDLIERLRDRYSKHSQELRDEAADALEAKDKKIERLRAHVQEHQSREGLMQMRIDDLEAEKFRAHTERNGSSPQRG